MAGNSGTSDAHEDSSVTVDGLGLAGKLAQSARQLHAQEDPDETLRAVVAAAVAIIPGAEDASIGLVANRTHLHTEASSSEFATLLDQLEEQCGEGPCLSAAYEHHSVLVDDTASEGRWPRFSARAGDAGAGSMLAVQLFVDGDSLGALNLYARRSHAFDLESVHVAELFASHAATAYSAARRHSHLLRATGTREIIGQAQGILIERHKITADQAFGMLVAASQSSNVKLREVADTLVRTGVLGPARA